MTLGWYSAVEARPFPEWRAVAERFDVKPCSVQEYIERHHAAR